MDLKSEEIGVAPRDDYDDEYGYGSGSYTPPGGHSRASSHDGGHGGQQFGAASPTASLEAFKNIGKDGTIAGIPVDSNIANTANVLTQVALNWVRGGVEKHARPILQNMAMQHWGHDAVRAAEFASRGSTILAGLSLFSPQFVEEAVNIGTKLRSDAELSRLRSQVNPVYRKAKGESTALSKLTGSGNEMLADLAAKGSGMFWGKTVQTGVSAISAMGNFLLWHNERKAQEASEKLAEKMKNFDKLSAEEQSKFLKEEMGLAISVGKSEFKALSAMLEAEEKAYRQGYEEWLKAASSKVSGKTNEQVLKDEFAVKVGYTAKGTPEDAPWKEEARRRYGLNTGYGSGYGNNRQYNDYANYSDEHISSMKRPDHLTDEQWEVQRERLIEQRDRQLKQLEAAFKQAFEKEKRAQYVLSHGAFDDKDLAALRTVDPDAAKDMKTIKSQITAKYDEFFRLKNETTDPRRIKEEAKKAREQTGIAEAAIYSGIGGVMGNIARKMFGIKDMEKYEQPLPIEYVVNLRRQVEEQNGKIPDRIEDLPAPEGESGKGGSGPKHGESLCLMDYVDRNVFDRHQVYRGQSKINDTERPHILEAHGDQQKFMEIPREELTPYEEGIRDVISAINNGADPLILIPIAGDRLIVQPDGKTFGPKGISGGDEVLRAKIRETVADVASKLRWNREMTPEELSEAKGNFALSEGTLTEFFKTETDVAKRAFVFTALEAHVPDTAEICRMTGLNAEEWEKLRKESAGHFDALLNAAVVELASEIRTRSECKQLEKDGIKLTDSEKHILESFARAVEEGHSVTDCEKKDEVKAAESVVASVAVKEKGFWQKLVGRREKLETEAKTAQEEKKAAEEAGEGESLAPRGPRAKSGGEADEFTSHRDEYAPPARLDGDDSDRPKNTRKPKAFDEPAGDFGASPDARDDEGFGGGHSAKMKKPGRWDEMHPPGGRAGKRSTSAAMHPDW